MNPSIQKLINIAQKKERLIIGLMSGTSLDGLDIALCRLSGNGPDTSVVLERFITKPYTPEYAEALKVISSVSHVPLSEVCYQHTKIADLHANWILEALKEWGIPASEVDCIASHGQSIYHLPARDQKKRSHPLNSTFQIGDGDHIAVKTGILTISDFRQKHTAVGGEGAPMAGLVDEILFRHQTESRVLLNIGGIGNFTYLSSREEAEKNMFTTDTGPGNTLIDKLTQHYFNQPFDTDAKLAKSGSIEKELLEVMLSDVWFDQNRTKTTGPEYFSLDWIKKSAQKIGMDTNAVPPQHLIRTVTELSAISITDSIKQRISANKEVVIYVSGGGVHNPLLMRRIRELLPTYQIHNFQTLGMDPDAKEALLFAVLANEMLTGEGFLMSDLTNDNHSDRVNFGKISFPQ